MNYEQAWSCLKDNLKEIIEHRDKNNPDYGDQLIIGLMNYILENMEQYEMMIEFKPEELKDKDYDFKGWDWTELSEKFNMDYIDLDKEKDPQYISCQIQDTLEYRKLYHFLVDNFENEEVVNEVRNYVGRISEYGDSGYFKMWEAMSEIESDYVFMQYTLALLTHMWT